MRMNVSVLYRNEKIGVVLSRSMSDVGGSGAGRLRCLQERR
jgi:hypothetical protein